VFLFLAEQAGEEAWFACRRCCFLSFRHVMAMTVPPRTVVVIIVPPVIFVVAIIIVTFMVTVIAVVNMIMPVAFMVIVTGRLSLC
jgi:hypothetical protein